MVGPPVKTKISSPMFSKTLFHISFLLKDLYPHPTLSTLKSLILYSRHSRPLLYLHVLLLLVLRR
jgi:hypothetical protein